MNGRDRPISVCSEIRGAGHGSALQQCVHNMRVRSGSFGAWPPIQCGTGSALVRLQAACGATSTSLAGFAGSIGVPPEL